MKHVFDQKELHGFYSYCMALTGNEQAAWDLLQDGLEKWVKRSDERVRHPHRYFKRILRNRYIDNYRRRALKAEQPYDEEDAVMQISTQPLEDIVATRQEVEAIMQRLTSEDRELLYLWAVEEYTARNIADLLEVPRGTILSRLYRLRVKIKSHVKKTRFSHEKKLQDAYK